MKAFSANVLFLHKIEFSMKKSILFVCLANICRSPAAEAVFSKVLRDRGFADNFEIDSAGIAGWYAGEPADLQMRQHALKRHYEITHISRKFNPDIDFDKFEMIIGMDDDIIEMLRMHSRKAEEKWKIFKMTDFRKVFNYTSVPDPYQGDEDAYELVLDLLEDACEGLIEKLERPIS
jgi:protein-tyrosine phosphatase